VRKKKKNALRTPEKQRFPKSFCHDKQQKKEALSSLQAEILMMLEPYQY